MKFYQPLWVKTSSKNFSVKMAFRKKNDKKLTPARKVAVDEPLALQVGHALGDLDGEVPNHVDGHVGALEHKH
jgi:hypothetical protein